MSFLLHKVTYIPASLAVVFQLQRSKAGTDLSAQSQNTLLQTLLWLKQCIYLMMETLLAKEKPHHYLFLF